MAATLAKRVESLEARFGIDTADAAFMAALGDVDARDYWRIMRRPGSGDFERFVRTLPDEDLRALYGIHARALAANGIDIRALLAGADD